MANALGAVAFPSVGQDDPVSLLNLSNAYSTGQQKGALTATIGPSDTTIAVSVTGGLGGYPLSSGAISIDDEVVLYAAATTAGGVTTFTGCLRGQQGSTAATHVAGTPAYGTITAAHITLVRDAVIATQAPLLGNGGPIWYNVLASAYGAKADYTSYGSGATVGAGGTAVVFAGANLQASDVGKRVEITGAGVAGGIYAGTLATVTDTTHATVNPAVTTAVTSAAWSYGTNNTGALQAAINACPRGSTVLVPNGNYWTDQIHINKKIRFLGMDREGNTALWAVSGAASPLIDVAIPAGVIEVDVVLGGTGYTEGQAMTFTGGGGSGATGTIHVTSGAITSVTVNTTGGGYTNGPTPVLPAGGSGATFNVILGTTAGLEVGFFNVVMGSNATTCFSARWNTSNYFHDMVVFGGARGFEFIGVQSSLMYALGVGDCTDRGFFVNGEHGASLTFRDCNVNVQTGGVTLQCGFEFWRNTWLDYGGFGIDNCAVTRNAGSIVNGWKLTASQANTVFAFGAAGLTSDNIDAGDSFVATNAVHVQLRGCWIGGGGGSSVVIDGGYNWIVKDCELFPLGGKGAIEFRGTLSGNAYTIITNNQINSGYCILMPASGTNPYGLIVDGNELAFSQGISNNNSALAAASAGDIRLGMAIMVAGSGGGNQSFQIFDGGSGWFKSFRVDGGGNFQILSHGFSPILYLSDSGGLYLRGTGGAFGATYTDTLLMQNVNNATSGAPVQQSTTLRWTGAAWSGSASQAMEARETLVPVTAATPSSYLEWLFSLNGGAWNPGMTLSSGGLLTLTAANAAIATTLTDALLLDNNTAATAGVPVQQSPSLHYSAQAWTGAASQSVDARQTLIPISAATPTGRLSFAFSVNDAAYTEAASLTNAGILGLVATGGYYQQAGVAGEPTTPPAGSLWYNTTQKAVRVQSAAGAQGLVGLLYANTADATAITAAAETVASTNYTIPANGLTAGKVLRIRAAGHYTTGTTAVTITFRVRLNNGATNTYIIQSGALTTTASLTNAPWNLEAYATIRAVGAAGLNSNLWGMGYVNMASAVSPAPAVLAGFQQLESTAVATFDATLAQTVQVTIQLSATTGAPSVTLRSLYVEAMN